MIQFDYRLAITFYLRIASDWTAHPQVFAKKAE